MRREPETLSLPWPGDRPGNRFQLLLPANKHTGVAGIGPPRSRARPAYLGPLIDCVPVCMYPLTMAAHLRIIAWVTLC